MKQTCPFLICYFYFHVFYSTHLVVTDPPRIRTINNCKWLEMRCYGCKSFMGFINVRSSTRETKSHCISTFKNYLSQNLVWNFVTFSRLNLKFSILFFFFFNPCRKKKELGPICKLFVLLFFMGFEYWSKDLMISGRP